MKSVLIILGVLAGLGAIVWVVGSMLPEVMLPRGRRNSISQLKKFGIP